ncbi:MAG: HAMP domain-containing histidine kinase [Deltaproteobacteria bacterium]|nr:HAMP domain-containing histidine kinase [Deltaproteobacteria bacterium]
MVASMSLRRKQVGVFLATVVVLFGIFAAILLLVAQRLTTEATVQTALLLARQVEIALADSLRQQRASPPPPTPPTSSSYWDFLGNLFPGKEAAKPSPAPRGTGVTGLMRAYVTRSDSIKAMWVLNPEGKVLYTSVRGTQSPSATDPALIQNLRQGTTIITTRGKGRDTYYDVAVPLQMPQGVRGPGGLRLWINPADWTELLSGLWRQLALLFVLAGAVALWGGFLTTTIYTRRFRLISNALREAEAGTYQARPRYAGQDEVGTSLDLIDRLVMKQRGARESPTPAQRLAMAAHTLAHELKNPLNAMAVHLELLRSAPSDPETGPAPDEEQRQSLGALEAEFHQVSQLVRDFADYTAPVTLERQPLDVAAVLKASLEAATAQYALQRIRLTADLPPGPWPLRGDSTRLRQAFDNLLRNAAEAQPDGGTITITGQHAGDEIILRFQDAGPGISPERRAAIFDFGSSTKPAGRGIGLPLSQLIVEAHGGTLQYEETTGSAGGATFRVTLPLTGGAF